MSVKIVLLIAICFAVPAWAQAKSEFNLPPDRNSKMLQERNKLDAEIKARHEEAKKKMPITAPVPLVMPK